MSFARSQTIFVVFCLWLAHLRGGQGAELDTLVVPWVRDHESWNEHLTQDGSDY